MKILLLGSSGFIGKNIKEFLHTYNYYHIMDPGRAQLDLLDELQVESYLKENRPDVVINAAVCRNPKYFDSKSELSELQQNLAMYYILEKYSKYFGKMLYFGSGAEYNKTYPIVNASETEFLNSIPFGEYAFSKYVIGKSIGESANIYNLRIFGLFGKYENWRTTFISGACCKAIKNVPITIRQNVFFDYMYINDFCKIVKWFVDHTPNYHDYNITTGKKIDLLSLANIVKEVSGSNVDILICRPGLANEYTANNQRLLNEIGEFTFTDIHHSVLEMFRYYQSIKDQIDLLPLLYQT